MEEEKFDFEAYKKEAVRKLLNAPDNSKYKTMLMCAYAAGLRVSEVDNLKVTDIDSKRMTIRMEQSKGKKDRLVMLGEKLPAQLRLYFKEPKLPVVGDFSRFKQKISFYPAFAVGLNQLQSKR